MTLKFQICKIFPSCLYSSSSFFYTVALLSVWLSIKPFTDHILLCRCSMIWTRTFTRPYQTQSSPSASTWMWSLNIWWGHSTHSSVTSLVKLLNTFNVRQQNISMTCFCLSVILPEGEGNGWWGIQQYCELLFQFQ